MYVADDTSFVIDKKTHKMSFELDLATDSFPTIQAATLKAEITLYKYGILRILINEEDGTEQRFRVSGIPDFAVMDDQLEIVEPIIVSKNENQIVFTHDESSVFRLQFAPFRIQNFVDGNLVMTINDNDTLYFEASTGKNANVCGLQKHPYTDFFKTNVLKQSVYPDYSI